MEYKDNLLGVISTIIRWKKPLLLLTGLAALGSAIISLTLPNFYLATTTFLVASPDQSKPELIYSRNPSFRTEYFGGSGDIDRLLSLGESQNLRDFIVDSFNLYAHYKIDSQQVKAPHLMKELFTSLYTIKKNKRDAIELSVEDIDPALAANMANAARNKIEAMAKQLIRESQRKTIENYEQSLAAKEIALLKLGDSIAILRNQFGVYNVIAQTETLTELISEAKALFIRDSVRLQILRANPQVPRDTVNMLDAKVAGLRQEVKMLSSEMTRVNEGTSRIYHIEKNFLESNQILAEDRERLKQWKSAYQTEAPAVLLLEQATTPVIKSRPKRSLLVIAVTLAAALFGIFGVLLFDTYANNVKNQLKHNQS
jgi:tyrosine-protein kinase Etk/Wzc